MKLARVRFFSRRAPAKVGSNLKIAEHSFQVPMPNLPQLLNHFCFGARFFARVKVNSRSIYSCILARACAVAMATGLVKTRLKKCFLFIQKNPVVRLFSFFAHYELTLNPFCQHCSNKIFDIDDICNSPLIIFCIIKNSLCQFRFFLIDQSYAL